MIGGVETNLVVVLHELLFRHIFETQIHIQKKIRKNLILALGTNDFSVILIKVSQRAANKQIINE